MSNHSIPPAGADELSVASTLIDEANALLRKHGADPHNDGTGDDLPVLTEVIFDLGDNAAPAASRRPKPPAPPAPPASPVSTRIPATAPKPPTIAPRAPRPAPEPVKQPSALQTKLPSVNIPASPSAFGASLQALRPSLAGITTRTPVQPAVTPRPPVQAKPAVRQTTPTPAPVRPVAVPPAPAPKPAPPTRTLQQTLGEELKRLDSLIAGEVENWMSEELPSLIMREVARLNERLRTEAATHLRTTLLPRLSEHITRISKLDRTENK